MSKIIAIGTAVPAFKHMQEDILQFMQLIYSYSEADKTASEPVRVNLTVREGTSARVDSLEGSLSFACAPAATAMTIQPIQRVAYTATAK